MLESVVSHVRQGVISVVPEAWLQRVRAFRRSPAFRRAGVVFIHVPKAAGTSISLKLYGRFIGHFGVSDVIAACPADVKALPRFAVARNPWDRLVSAWSFATAGAGPGGAIAVRIRQPRQYQTEQCRDFDRFVNEWLQARDLSKLDGVFRPQTDYLLDSGGTAPFDHIGRLERLDDTERWLSDMLREPFSFGRSNVTKHAHYTTYYTPQTRDLVAEIYARDIALLGYDF